MSDILYFPVIKTRDAELRCFKHLDNKTKDLILPIYELTKSRRTTLVPDGDINRRMKDIRDIQAGRPFILDLTTDERYTNSQVEKLLDERNGFSEWFYFIFEQYKDLNIIPMIHLYGDSDYKEVKQFVSSASQSVGSKRLALRLPTDLKNEELDRILVSIKDSLENSCQLYIIFDVGYFSDNSSFNESVGNVISSCEVCEKYNNYISDIILVSTSFPLSPAQAGGEDQSGNFKVLEEELYFEVKKSIPYIKYGDYVSINTEQIELKAGTFVPRIDLISEECDRFYYERYRRKDGGYIECARAVKRNSQSNGYSNLGIWATDQIELAAGGNPEGISPSYWISVRMNYYVYKKINIRKKDCF